MDKTFDAATAEPRIYEAWERAGAFRAGAGARRDETFCILLPPPNVTGTLHVGHAFNHTLMDVLVRWHRMRGFDTLWQPGLDHAGIATQMVVERELAERGNVRRQDMTREDFLAKVWEWKERSGGAIVAQDKRLGCSMDWERSAFTMGEPGSDRGFPEAVARTFVDLYERGVVYRGKRLVNWDPHFETAISDLEVEAVETPGHMWHFRYPLAPDPETGERESYEYVERDEDGRETLRETRDWISIATTRPETMLGDGAVAVHPSDERYAPIVGRLCEIPVGPREHRRLIPIVTDEYPDPAFGSGAVKITGAHDFNDYGVATRQGIPLYALMDGRARMREDGHPYAESAARASRIARGEEEGGDVSAVNLVPEDLRGLDRLEARARVVEQITAEGLAVMVPPTDPRLGPKATKTAAALRPAAEEAPGQARGGGGTGGAGGPSAAAGARDPAAPAPEPGPRPAGRESPDRVQGTAPGGATGAPALEPGPRAEGAAVEPEEGGEARADALVPLVEPKLIMQPMGERSSVVIEPMLTDQWFVDTDRIVGPAIDSVRRGMARPEGSTEGTRILPEQDAKVYFNWLENIEPWCISRQLWWGHRIPVWYGPKMGRYGGKQIDQPILSWNPLRGPRGNAEMDSDFKFFCVLPTEVDEVLDHYYAPFRVVIANNRDHFQELLSKHYRSKGEKPEDKDPVPVFQDPDVLDTWFSSGLWPVGTLGWPEDTPELKRYFPTDVLVTGFDIVFFWVARMMMMQHAVLNPEGDRDPEETKPFHTVYVHGLIRDEHGAKMSKSKGNVVDPLELVDRYGADALRFTMTSIASMGRDLRLSEARVEGNRNFATKLWNAARFAASNGARFGAPLPSPTQTINRWIVGETTRARLAVDAALHAYRFDGAAQTLYGFVWNRVCDWYLEMAKPLLDGPHAEETRETLGWVIDQCLILLHPVMPFVTEALWGALAERPRMLVLTPWPEHGLEVADARADREAEWVIGLVEAVRSVRGETGVPAGARVPMLEVELGEDERGFHERNAALIHRLARIASVERVAEAPKGAASIPVPGGLYALPLADVIDVGAERARLEKSLAKLGRELGGLRGRLGNPKFVESAPEAVVAETRANLAAREAEEAKLRAALARLAEVA